MFLSWWTLKQAHQHKEKKKKKKNPSAKDWFSFTYFTILKNSFQQKAPFLVKNNLNMILGHQENGLAGLVGIPCKS